MSTGNPRKRSRGDMQSELCSSGQQDPAQQPLKRLASGQRCAQLVQLKAALRVYMIRYVPSILISSPFTALQRRQMLSET